MGKQTFRDLSRRERLYRFRKLAKNALRVYGLENAELKFLQYGENVIYRVDCPNVPRFSRNNSPYLPDRYLLRLHAWDEPDYIKSEMTWLDALANKANLPVPAPLRTPDEPGWMPSQTKQTSPYQRLCAHRMMTTSSKFLIPIMM